MAEVLNQKEINLQPGDTWTSYPPTPEDRKRIQKNHELFKLYAGKFHGVLTRLERYTVESPLAPVIKINFFQTMSQEFAKLLFGEDIQITVPAAYQERINEIMEYTSLQSKLMQMSEICSSVGGCPLKTWRDEKGRVHIDLVNNNIYFPSHDPDDCTELTGQTLAWEREDTDTGVTYIVREIHTPGQVLREVLDRNFNPDEAQYAKWYPGIPAIVTTGFDGMFVEYIPNFRFGTQFWGISDYDQIKDIVEELMLRVSMIADILSKHARPKQILPSELLSQITEMADLYRNELSRLGIITRNEADVLQTRKGDVPRGLDAIYVPSEQDKGNLPRMFTWDSNMQGAMEEIDRLFDLFLSLSCMSPETFGISKYGVSESGRALKFRNQRTLAAANRKRQFMLPGLKRLIQSALFLAGANVALRDISIVMQDGLPFDELEATQISNIWITAGLATRTSAILHARPDLSPLAAEEEAREIDEGNSEDQSLQNLMPNNSRSAVNANGGNSAEDTEADEETA
jgi:hypothetical protein